MLLPLQELYSFIAKLTLLGLHGAVIVVVPILEDHCLEAAVLAGLFLVYLFFVLFLLSLRYALAALLALVILTRAANVMHSELGDLDVFVTNGASLGFDRAVDLLHIIDFFQN